MKCLATTICLTIALLLGSAVMSWSADFEKGLTAYESGDFANALREWSPLAEQGNAAAQYNLGVMYDEGKGVSQNYKIAVKWYRLAAEQGDAAAQYNLGVMYDEGKGVPQDDETALKWYSLAAEQGDAVSVEQKDAVSVEQKDAIFVEQKDAVSVEQKDAVSVEQKDAVSVEQKDAVPVEQKDAVPVTHAGKRVALVIGNDTYKTLPALNNAGADARGMAAKLKSLGFEVILKLNADRRDISRSLAEFEGRSANAEVALLFYAGHGIQASGTNYLIPSDARVEVKEDLELEGVASSLFLQKMKNAGAILNIVILDACRDNPLPRQSRSATRGLTVTPVPVGIGGTAVVYSAAPGQTAQDGPKGGHGVFTGALLQVLDRPGLKLEDVFKQTARQVAALTNGKQDPWINSSVKGDFYFRPGKAIAPKISPTDQSAEIAFWKTIEKSKNPDSFKAYLSQHPTGSFAALARVKLDELESKQTASLPPPAVPVEEVDASYVALKAANVRAGPSTSSAKVDLVPRDSGVTVTGKVAGGKWFRVERPGGKVGYVIATLLAPADEVSTWTKVRDTKARPVQPANLVPTRKNGVRTYFLEAITFRGQELKDATDVLHRRFMGLPNSKVKRQGKAGVNDTVVTAAITRTDTKRIENPDYQGAVMAKQLFGNMFRGVIPDAKPFFTVYDFEVMVHAQDRAGGITTTETGRAIVKLKDYGDKRTAQYKALLEAVSNGGSRLVTRLMGGAPEIWKPPQLVPQRSNQNFQGNRSTSEDNYD